MKHIPNGPGRAAVLISAVFSGVFLISILTAPEARGEVICLRDGNCIAGTSATPLDDLFLRLHTLEGARDVERADIILHRTDGQLRKTLKNVRESMEPGDKKCMIQLAWWCRQKGLYEDMFELYDGILALDPNDGDVQAFVDEMAEVIDFGAFQGARRAGPESAAGIFKASAGEDPTLSRIGQAILLQLPDRILTPVLVAKMQSRNDDERELALRILTKKHPPEALEPLVKSAIFHRDAETRALSVDALVQYEDRRIVNPFIAALRLKYRDYRLNAMEGLARLNDPRASGALIANLAPAGRGSGGATRAHVFVGTQHAAVTGFDTQIASSAAIAAPVVSTIQEGALLDVKVFGAVIYTVSKDERLRIGLLLKNINGIDYGTDYVLWKEWWDQNKSGILAQGQ
jgi:hypothetical protein